MLTSPSTSTVLGVPLIFLAAQLMLGQSPWLPAFVARRSMSRADFSSLVKRIVPCLLRADLGALARPPMEHLIGLLALLLAVVLVLPIPLGNVLPALALSVLALGVLERDGVWVLAAIAVAGAAVSVVSGVVFAMVKAGVYFFARAVS